MEFRHFLFCFGMMVNGAWSLKPSDSIMWIPDASGVLHALDLLTPKVDDFTLPLFNGEKQVNMSLYTQQNRNTSQRIRLSDNSTYPNFNSTNPTRFVIHGWTANADRFIVVKDGYMDTGMQYNVVLVDWRGPANSAYPIAKEYAILVGKYVAKVIKYLEQNRGLNLRELNIIGHSLGAHAAGVTGNNLKGKVAKIVGLDPAAPLYTFVPRKWRLDKSDARIVQGIHTNAGLIGWKDPIGDVDFYPNGGTWQPGCGFDPTGFCSHSRSPFLFAESITSRGFVSSHCNSYKNYQRGKCTWRRHDVMGEWTSPWSRGRYYLKTNGKPPYAQGRTDL